MIWFYILAAFLLSNPVLGQPGHNIYYENPKEALLYYEKKVDEDKYNRMNYYDLASAYKEFGENRKAFDAYRSILSINDSEIRSHFELAKAYYFLGANVYAEEEIKYLARRSRVNWEVCYWWGCILMEQKKYDEAIVKFSEAIDKDEFKCLPYLKMAETYEKKGDIDNAIKYYEKTLKKDKTYTELNRKIAELYEKNKEFVQAYNYWKTVGEIDTKNVQSKIKVEKYADLIPKIKRRIAEYKAEKEEKRELYIPPNREPVEGAGDITVLRIGIMKGANSIHFKCGSDFEVIDEKGKSLFKGDKLTEYVVVSDKSSAHIENGDKKVTFKKDVKLVRDDRTATTNIFNIKYGQGFYWAEQADTSYRGDFEILFKDKNLNLVNLVNAEEYLFGVVPSEIPAYWPEEALKAQAVAARTYTFKHIGHHSKDGFDLCATQHCAVYKGLKSEHKRTNKAVLETKGEVLYGSNYKLLTTFFSHCCGGQTQDVNEVWGVKSIGSLGGVPDGPRNKWKFPLSPFYLEEWVRTFPDVYCKLEGKGETSFRWIRYLNADDLEYFVNRKYKVGRIKSITPIKRARGGAITKILIEGSKGRKKVKFDPIRNVLGKIRNNVIKWEYRKDSDGYIRDIYIYGAGWGHAVGMCQRGTMGMAEKGKNHREILYHYFPGSYIRKKY